MGWSKTSRSEFSSNAESASYVKGENKIFSENKNIQIHGIVLNVKELTKAHLIRKQVQQILVTDPTCQGGKLGTNCFCQSF